MFLKSLEQYYRPNKLPELPVLGANFYISPTKKKMDLHKYFFTAEDFRIFCRKNPDSPEIAYMNIENCFLKRGEVEIKGVKYYFLKFVKKGIFEQLFHEKKEVVDLWFNHFKHFCVLTNFRDYFT